VIRWWVTSPESGAGQRLKGANEEVRRPDGLNDKAARAISRGPDGEYMVRFRLVSKGVALRSNWIVSGTDEGAQVLYSSTLIDAPNCER